MELHGRVPIPDCGLIPAANGKRVQRTFGMSDDDFIQWVQKAQPFDTANGPRQITGTRVRHTRCNERSQESTDR